MTRPHFLRSLISFPRTILGIVIRIPAHAKKHPRISIAVVVVILALLSGIIFFGGEEKNTEDSTGENQLSSVELIPVALFGEGAANSANNTTGSEIVARAETAGKIIRVLPEGTRVSTGTVLAEFENASQRASLLQAEGSLEAAEAALEKTKGGPRSEKLAVLEAAFASAQSGAVNTLLSSYASVDSAVRDTADQMFSNPESGTPQLSFSSSNSQRRIKIENTRVTLGGVLERQKDSSESISTNSNLESEFATTENEVREARAFIDELIGALNEAITTGDVSSADISAYKTAATTARTALTTALSSIASARASLETTKQNLDEGLSGAESTDVAAAQATVKQAQGTYDAALAAYQKSIVRSGASGTVISCNAQVGDVLSVGSDVCRIKTSGVSDDTTFFLPLSSVKYTPAGAFVFVVSENGTLDAIEITTGLVTANGIIVTGLFGDEYVVKDVRGLKSGETVHIQ